MQSILFRERYIGAVFNYEFSWAATASVQQFKLVKRMWQLSILLVGKKLKKNLLSKLDKYCECVVHRMTPTVQMDDSLFHCGIRFMQSIFGFHSKRNYTKLNACSSSSIYNESVILLGWNASQAAHRVSVWSHSVPNLEFRCLWFIQNFEVVAISLLLHINNFSSPYFAVWIQKLNRKNLKVT